ncbi:MAG: hypothetical protein JO325_08340 [Solirubrobacterales bacterium]|nr:hypothetical protein [Solirubrobacterales bacterium]
MSLGALSNERWLFPRITGRVLSTYDRLMRRACATAGFEPEVLFEINDCQTARGFLAAGMGVAVLPHRPTPSAARSCRSDRKGLVRSPEPAPCRRLAAAATD